MTILNTLVAISKTEKAEGCHEIKATKMYFAEDPFNEKEIASWLVKRNEATILRDQLICCEDLAPITWDFTVYYESVNGGKPWPADMYSLSYNEALDKFKEVKAHDRYISASPIMPRVIRSKGNNDMNELLSLIKEHWGVRSIAS